MISVLKGYRSCCLAVQFPLLTLYYDQSKSIQSQVQGQIHQKSINQIFLKIIENEYLTSLNGNNRNSSVDTTSWKWWRANLWDLLCSSLHEWASAKLRIPRQFDGWSCRIRNLQQASRTDEIWSKFDAGSRTCTLSSVIVTSPARTS